ncbi:uncharacterized protein LOC117549728 [Gymnodraco acuticeps]|nr:uncharacterized protein LOC117549728 [Gymnodraco acuticeps]
MTDSACQTDPPKYRTVRTQLSSRTLGSHRSTAVQAKIPCRSVGVETLPLEVPVPFLTSTPLKRPPKRPRVDLEEEYEDPFEGSSSLVFSEGQDATYDPAESITNATETTAMSGQEQNPPQTINTYIVYETCLMELFESCPVCKRVCDVQTRRIGTFISVQQLCPHCQFTRNWNSQPVLGSTPVGNLQLSVATYVNGASFYKLSKVFKAMNMQLCKYNTF